MHNFGRLILIALMVFAGVAGHAAAQSIPQREFLIVKAKTKSKELKLNSKDIEKKKDLRSNVKTYRGAKYITGIPMIDQGNSPTCAIATVRRLLCYFTGEKNGSKCPISTKVLEKELGYSKKVGTNTGIMVRALQKNAPKLHLSCGFVYGNRLSVKERIEAYNKLAVQKKVNKVEYSDKKDQLEDYTKKIKYKVWKEMRDRQQDGERKQCWKAIRDNIDKGIPLCWSVQLGLYSESGIGRQQNGGHMRLIIGYNEQKKKIYYSDSWGNGHDRKEMDWDDAWAITDHVIVLAP